MDKQLHIHILDVLHQSNAIGNMVDIKAAFLDELDTQEKRKNFKAQIDYLVSEHLIETNGKFEFLGWELLTGLYPIDNKKIEARLTGKWESYLAVKRGGGKAQFNLPPPPPPPAPTAKLGLYDAPSTVLPYPGVNVNKPTQPPAPAPVRPEPVIATEPKDEEDDFMPFTVKAKNNTPTPLVSPTDTNKDVYLKEDDFLPFKSRMAAKQAEPALPMQQPTAAKVSNTTPPPIPTVPEPVAVKPNTYTLPAPEQAATKPTYTPPHVQPEQKPDAEPDFSASKTIYSPPKTESKDIAITVKPFTPPAPQTTPQQPVYDADKPTRIAAHAKRKVEEDDDAPIITARTAGLRAKPMPEAPAPAPAPTPEPQHKEVPPSARVVNLSSSAVSQNIKTVEPVMASLRNVPAAQAPGYQPPVTHTHNPITPPPSVNFAAIRFDTDNNPFAGLGTIDLTTADEPPKKSPIWAILKWAAIGFVLLVIIAAIVIYKKRYS